jgi:hypothetical protein
METTSQTKEEAQELIFGVTIPTSQEIDDKNPAPKRPPEEITEGKKEIEPKLESQDDRKKRKKDDDVGSCDDTNFRMP